MSQEKRRDQAGQSAILVAFLFLGLLIFAAIAVDISNAYFHRRTAQNAADAAAVAGAQEVGRIINREKKHDDDTVREAMVNLAGRNDIENPEVNMTGYYLDSDGLPIDEHEIGDWPNKNKLPDDVHGVQANIKNIAPGFFGSIIGYDSYTLDALAEVRFEDVCTAGGCVLPIAIHGMGFESEDLGFETGQCYNMWDGPGAANRGWVNFTYQGFSCDDLVGVPDSDCNTGCLEALMDPTTCDKNGITIEYGDYVGGIPGNHNSSGIRSLLKYYIGALPETPTWTAAKILVFDEIADVNGKRECGIMSQHGEETGFSYHIVGFATFRITGYYLPSGQGQETYCIGDPTAPENENCYDLPCVGEDPEFPCFDTEGVFQADPGECVDYPETCIDPDTGEPCLYESGDYARITGIFVPSIDPGGEGNCQAVGNLMSPRITR